MEVAGGHKLRNLKMERKIILSDSWIEIQFVIIEVGLSSDTASELISVSSKVSVKVCESKICSKYKVYL